MLGDGSDDTKQKTFHGRIQTRGEAVRLAEQPCSNVSQVARDLGLDLSVLRRWVGQMRVGIWVPTDGKPLKSEQQQEIEQLCRELAKVKTERDRPSRICTSNSTGEEYGRSSLPVLN